MSSLTDESQKVNNKKDQAEKTRVILEEQTVYISNRKTSVEAELAGAEPALIAAMEAVSGVTK